MLHQLYADNYKCLVNFELPLQDLTLLLGSNGAGKTSVLDVVFRLRRVLVDGIKIGEREAFPTSTLTRWDTRSVQSFGLDVEVEGDRFHYQLAVEHERATGRCVIESEQLQADGRPLFSCLFGEVQLYRDDHSKGPRLSVNWEESFLARVSTGRNNRRLNRFMNFMRGLTVCALHPQSIAAESAHESTLLQRDGANFADWYRHLVQERTELVVDFTSSLKDVLQDFRGIRMEKVGEDTRAMLVSWRGRESYTLRFDEISDGQRVLIVLYALIGLAGDRRVTLFLDEPDNYTALSEIQPWLMALVDACGSGNCQAIVCSHHPELIDYLGTDKGILLDRTDSGVTRIRDLSAMELKGDLRLSQLVARGWLGE